jgi:hypothetical protein
VTITMVFSIGSPLVVRIIGVACLCSCYSTYGKNGYFNNDAWPLVSYQSFKKMEPRWVMFSKIVYNKSIDKFKRHVKQYLCHHSFSMATYLACGH